MVKNIVLFLLLPTSLFSQTYESWNTINVSGKLSKNTTLLVEGEQRYNFTESRVRYFHYDIGYCVKLNQKNKLGLYVRDIYEMKKNYRIHEFRPHLDYFYESGNWKIRTRAEYQIKEIYGNNWRFRIRPLYQSDLFRNINPYFSTEFNFTEKGITRNRTNIGLTIKSGDIEIQPGYLIESNGAYSLRNFKHLSNWSYRNSLWINFKVKLT